MHIERGTLYDANNGRVVALDSLTGEPIWISEPLGGFVKSVFYSEHINKIAVRLPYEDRVAFLDPIDGRLSSPAISDVKSDVLFIDQNIVYGSSNAVIMEDATNGTVLWSLPIQNTIDLPTTND